MGRKPEITELPTRFLMAELGSGKRWKRIAAVAGVGVVVASGAGVYLLKTVEANQAAALRAQWGVLQGCVLGEALGPNETPSSRFRGIQLAVLATPRERRAKGQDLPWPVSCGPAATSLAEHAESAQSGGTELKTSSAALARSMRDDPSAISDLGKQIEQVWKDAAAAGLKAEPRGVDAVARPAARRPGSPGRLSPRDKKRTRCRGSAFWKMDPAGDQPRRVLALVP